MFRLNWPCLNILHVCINFDSLLNPIKNNKDFILDKVMQSLTIPVTKMSGTGNDFIVINLMSKNSQTEFLNSIQQENLSSASLSLCSNQTPWQGADGSVFLLPSDKCDFKWEFFNKDGSSAEMCGNAARCVALYAQTKGLAQKTLCFETLAGIIQAEILPANRVDITFRPITEELLQQKVHIQNQEYIFDFVNSGVPHAVFTTDHIFERLEDLKIIAQHMRQPDFFKPCGANITFKEDLSPTHINSITFERGVENFTQACGTGAVASAYTHYKKYQQETIQVSLPGGDLEVRFNGGLPHLIGPAIFIQEYNI